MFYILLLLYCIQWYKINNEIKILVGTNGFGSTRSTEFRTRQTYESYEGLPDRVQPFGVANCMLIVFLSTVLSGIKGCF